MPGYEDNELADGSNDEKRLYKAKLQAGRKDQPNRKWRPRFGGDNSESPSSGSEALKPVFECGQF